MRRLPLLACAIALLLPVTAQARDDNDGALWLVNQVAMPIDGERVSLHLMVQNRWVQDLEDYQRTVIRPWLRFDATDWLELSLGYDAHNFEEPDSNLENRAWQRIGLQHDLGPARLLTHFWLEERFFEGSAKVAWRGRFNFGFAFDLPADFDLVVRNEWFVDLNTTPRIRRVGLGENQFVAAIGHPLGSWLRVETGYLQQYLDQKGPDTFNHTFTFGFAATTPALLDLF